MHIIDTELIDLIFRKDHTSSDGLLKNKKLIDLQTNLYVGFDLEMDRKI